MIEEIVYKQKIYPFLYAWSAHKEFTKIATREKVDFTELPEKGMHLGFVYGAKKRGIRPITIGEMAEMFDDDPEFHSQVAMVWNKHLGVQKKIQDKILKGLNL